MTVHEQLIAQGFAHTHHGDSVTDHGNGETGPMIDYGPPYDEYLSATERVIVVDGEVVLHEPRDLAFEAWCDAQAEKESAE